jgi:N-acetyl-gamma-glutamyl-phosphate reductase
MGDIEMNFTDTVNPNVNVVFLCLGHGKSIHFQQNQCLQNQLKEMICFIWFLPELNKANIKNANHMQIQVVFANQLLLPLADGY